MNFHPDVLAVHAQFGGDLESMQALYDRPGHVAEIARLQEQVETQRIGHQLTAKEATANLLRANRIEAGLEEMTRSCLAERDGRLAAEAERDRLREAGAGLANAAYNLAQNDAIPTRDRIALKQAQEQWDAALQKEPQP